eukprot:CAMPEP_0182851236 /NCGR_PEP_ID=MMETSP0006_2-20121128/30523_1 /TAXON_ID=97485 /ORGANISM="Prymnesium parvum, Strain Texoma1" /LENGTH=38 /DNA_ID= /DNA_START= /DNA_END= /DNA_ORIENTATION=
MATILGDRDRLKDDERKLVRFQAPTARAVSTDEDHEHI